LPEPVLLLTDTIASRQNTCEYNFVGSFAHSQEIFHKAKYSLLRSIIIEHAGLNNPGGIRNEGTQISMNTR
jgi:hypothetical protein